MKKMINVSLGGGGEDSCSTAFQYGAFVLLLLFLAIPITADGQTITLNQRIEIGEVVTRDSWIVRTSRPNTRGKWIQFRKGNSHDSGLSSADIDLPSPIKCYVNQSGWCFFRGPSFKVKHNPGCTFDAGYKKVHLVVETSRDGSGYEWVKPGGEWKLTIYEGETKEGCTCPPDDMVSNPDWYAKCDTPGDDFYSPATGHDSW